MSRGCGEVIMRGLVHWRVPWCSLRPHAGPPRMAIQGALLFILVAMAGCGRQSHPVATVRSYPTPVAVAPEPYPPSTLGDPSFQPLAGAAARYGRLGGSVYEIEIPDNWNRKLVLYLHGQGEQYRPTLEVELPPNRSQLIREGYAWAASSFSRLDFQSSTAADETAALWDKFVTDVGRPDRTFVIGESAGGVSTLLSAERYGDRYAAALALCTGPGLRSDLDFLGDSAVAGAFAAGLTQSDFDPATIRKLMAERILPALRDPAVHQRFSDIWVQLTGGHRAFDQGGLALSEDFVLTLGARVISGGSYDNAGRHYDITTSGGDARAFDDGALRVRAPNGGKTYPSEETSGAFVMPVMELKTTGDGRAPLMESQLLRRLAQDAGKGGSLVQRTVEAAGHCAFTTGEIEDAFADLVIWVEHGAKPAGEDLLAKDLTSLGGTFTKQPRLGSPAADAVAGASDRITLAGRANADGAPVDSSFLRVLVEKDGLFADCRLDYTPVVRGTYERIVASKSEVRGCGEVGAHVFLETRVNGQILTSLETADWPGAAHNLHFDATFAPSNPSGAALPFTMLYGDVVDSSGKRLPSGTVIEAYIGDTQCGEWSIPTIAMPVDSYWLFISGPDSRPGCGRGATITIRVDGNPVAQTITNELDGPSVEHRLDIVTP